MRILKPKPRLKPNPGEKGKETAERDMRNPPRDGMAIVLKEFLCLIVGSMPGSLQLTGTGFLVSFNG